MNNGFDLLLAGAGHCHLDVLQQWASRERPMGRATIGQSLRHYHPQTHSLALLAEGHRGALLSWARLAAEGRLLGRKDHIDRNFMRQLGAED